MDKDNMVKFSLFMPVEYHRLLKVYCIENNLKLKDFFMTQIKKFVDEISKKEK